MRFQETRLTLAASELFYATQEKTLGDGEPSIKFCCCFSCTTGHLFSSKKYLEYKNRVPARLVLISAHSNVRAHRFTESKAFSERALSLGVKIKSHADRRVHSPRCHLMNSKHRPRAPKCRSDGDRCLR
jgi:hypothetical protein